MSEILVCNLKGCCLKTGQIFALSQSDGSSPVFNDCVKMICKIGEISAAQYFNM